MVIDLYGMIYLFSTFLLSSFHVAVSVLRNLNFSMRRRMVARLNLTVPLLILCTSVCYLGWLFGLVALAFCLLSLPYSTFGWLLSVPAFRRFRGFARNDDLDSLMAGMQKLCSRMEIVYLIVFIWYAVFLVLSFIDYPYGDFRSWWTLPRLLIFLGVCAVGFVSRAVYMRVTKSPNLMRA